MRPEKHYKIIAGITLVLISLFITNTVTKQSLSTQSDAQNIREIKICDGVEAAIPPGIKWTAFNEPEKISGWGLPENPQLPPSSQNIFRTSFTLKNNLNPYHPLYNSGLFVSKCPEVKKPTSFSITGKIIVDDKTKLPGKEKNLVAVMSCSTQTNIFNPFLLDQCLGHQHAVWVDVSSGSADFKLENVPSDYNIIAVHDKVDIGNDIIRRITGFNGQVRTSNCINNKNESQLCFVSSVIPRSQNVNFQISFLKQNITPTPIKGSDVNLNMVYGMDIPEGSFFISACKYDQNLKHVNCENAQKSNIDMVYGTNKTYELTDFSKGGNFTFTEGYYALVLDKKITLGGVSNIIGESNISFSANNPKCLEIIGSTCVFYSKNGEIVDINAQITEVKSFLTLKGQIILENNTGTQLDENNLHLDMAICDSIIGDSCANYKKSPTDRINNITFKERNGNNLIYEFDFPKSLAPTTGNYKQNVYVGLTAIHDKDVYVSEFYEVKKGSNNAMVRFALANITKDRPVCKNEKGSGAHNLVIMTNGFTSYHEAVSYLKKSIKDLERTNLGELLKNFTYTYHTDITKDYVCSPLLPGNRAINCSKKIVEESRAQCNGTSTLLIVNGGPGGIALTDIHQAFVGVESMEVTAHELAHSIAGILDEYLLVDRESYPEEDERFEKKAPNCTKSDKCEKWLPEEGSGCFKGCTFTNWYRPEEQSIMEDHKYNNFNKPSLRAWAKAFKEGMPSVTLLIPTPRVEHGDIQNSFCEGAECADNDLNEDGVINGFDYILLTESLKDTDSLAQFDINNDNTENVLDLSLLIQHMGETIRE